MRNNPNPAISDEQFNLLLKFGFEYDEVTNSLCWTCFLDESSGVSFDIFKEDDKLVLYYGEFENNFDVMSDFEPSIISAENIIKIIEPYINRAYDWRREIGFLENENLTNLRFESNLILQN